MIAYGISEKGEHRRDNQDSILICQDGDSSGLFIVADGVGGSLDGGSASRYIVQQYQCWWEQIFLPSRTGTFAQLFADARDQVETISDDIYDRADTGNSCSTMVLLFLHTGRFGWISCGDSRIYRCDGRGTRQLTRDDTWENRPGGGMESIHAGKILSAVGGYEDLEYSFATGRIQPDEVFCLCSDGIYKAVPDKDFTECMQFLRQTQIFDEETALHLARLAAERDTRDNYSLVTVKV